MKRSLPVLQNGLVDLSDIRIASPCDADWDAMKGNDKTRFCGDCELNVHDFTAMSHEEISDILTKTEGRVCGTLYMREDGTFLTEDCPVGLARKALLVTKRTGLKVAALGLALISIFLVALFSSGSKSVCDPTPTVNEPNAWEVKVKEKQEKLEHKIEELEKEIKRPQVRGRIRRPAPRVKMKGGLG